jgi:hypothetical protein
MFKLLATGDRMDVLYRRPQVITESKGFVSGDDHDISSAEGEPDAMVRGLEPAMTAEHYHHSTLWFRRVVRRE